MPIRAVLRRLKQKGHEFEAILYRESPSQSKRARGVEVPPLQGIGDGNSYNQRWEFLRNLDLRTVVICGPANRVDGMGWSIHCLVLSPISRPAMESLFFSVSLEQRLLDLFLPTTVYPKRKKDDSACSTKSSAKPRKKNRNPTRRTRAGTDTRKRTPRKSVTSSPPLTTPWIPTAKTSLVTRWQWSSLRRGPQRIQSISCQKRNPWPGKGFHQSEHRVSHPSPWAVTSQQPPMEPLPMLA